MLESEAKKKWCPLVRFPTWGDGGPSGGNEPRGGSEANCIGSACMMWVKDIVALQECDNVGHCGLIKS